MRYSINILRYPGERERTICRADDIQEATCLAESYFAKNDCARAVVRDSRKNGFVATDPHTGKDALWEKRVA